MKISPLTETINYRKLFKNGHSCPRADSVFHRVQCALLWSRCANFSSQDKTVQIRSLRLAVLRAEEIKPQQESTQLIFHIHGGAFYLGSLNTHRAFMTQIAARTQMQVLHVDYPLSPESAYPEALEALFDVYNLLLDQGVQAKDIISVRRFLRCQSGLGAGTQNTAGKSATGQRSDSAVSTAGFNVDQ